MAKDFVALVEEGRALDSSLFSLARLELLAALAPLGPDGVTFRELKSFLGFSDGALWANLSVLKKSGYVASDEVRVEKKSLVRFWVTPPGLQEWNKVKSWLNAFSGD